MKKKHSVLTAGAVTLAVALISIVVSGSAGAGQPLFVPVPVADNVAALNGPPLFNSPPSVAQLSSDLHPANAAVHELGAAGWVWKRDDGSTCVMMVNRAGGCGTTFNQPVLLFLERSTSTDGTTRLELDGVVPNHVKSVQIVTTAGAQVATSIKHNAFAVNLPVGSSIVGEQVTLRNGESFFNSDPLSLPTQ